MISLMRYLENTILNEGLTDDDILFRLGTYVLNALPPNRKDTHKKRYGLPGTGRQGVLNYMAGEHSPLISQDQEFIPRDQWDLNGLYGITERQLVHPDYYRGINEVFKRHKRRHDILTIFQCAAKKPYYDIRSWKTGFVQFYSDFTDFACISNPGIIPFEWSSHYPFRYDEWSIKAEMKLKDIVQMTHKYRIVNTCRLIRFKRKMGYKYIITYIPNILKNWVFENAINYDIDGAREWCRICITQELFDKCWERYAQMPHVGMITSRLTQLESPHISYMNAINSCVTDSDQLERLKEIHQQKIDRCRNKDYVKLGDKYIQAWDKNADTSKYQIIDTLPYKTIKDAFKDHHEDSEYLYKKYYWTCLDILLTGMGDNLIEDIDGRYWELMDELEKDDDFEKVHDFLFIYKPALPEGITIDDVKKEAYKLRIIRDDEEPVLRIK